MAHAFFLTVALAFMRAASASSPGNVSSRCELALSNINHTTIDAYAKYYNANLACFGWSFDPKLQDAETRTCTVGEAAFKAACVKAGGDVFVDRHRLRMALTKNYHDRLNAICMPTKDKCDADDIGALERQVGMAWCKSFGLFLIDECDVKYLTNYSASVKSGAASLDTVKYIPGYGPPRAPLFAGRIAVDPQSRGVELFYVFTSRLPEQDHAPPPPSSVPIIVWFQGGGGASPPWGSQTGPFALDGYAGGGPSTFGMLCEVEYSSSIFLVLMRDVSLDCILARSSNVANRAWY